MQFDCNPLGNKGPFSHLTRERAFVFFEQPLTYSQTEAISNIFGGNHRNIFIRSSSGSRRGL